MFNRDTKIKKKKNCVTKKKKNYFQAFINWIYWYKILLITKKTKNYFLHLFVFFLMELF